MNTYDKVEEVLSALDEVATAIGALATFNHLGPLNKGTKAQLLAFMPGYHTAEKKALEAWEASVAKDGRRAVKLLFADYREQKSKLEELLAAECESEVKKEIKLDHRPHRPGNWQTGGVRTITKVSPAG